MTGIDEWVYWLLALVSPTAFAMAFDRLMVFESLNLPIDLWASMGSMPLGGMLIMLAVGNNMGYENAFESLTLYLIDCARHWSKEGEIVTVE